MFERDEQPGVSGTVVGNVLAHSLSIAREASSEESPVEHHDHCGTSWDHEHGLIMQLNMHPSAHPVEHPRIAPLLVMS